MIRFIKTLPLTDKQQQVYDMREGGMSFKEICRELGVSRNTVTNTMAQAVAKLNMKVFREAQRDVL